MALKAEIAEAEWYFALGGKPHRAVERRFIATGQPGLRVRCYPGVKDDVRKCIRSLARWLRKEFLFKHPTHIYVADQATVINDEDDPGWCIFIIPHVEYVRGDVVRIYVGGGYADLLETHYGFSRKKALIELAHCVCHEVIHYEQWRDGKSIVERNVNRRAAAMVRRWLLAGGQALPK